MLFKKTEKQDYQPKVNMQTDEVIGAESLIRGEHPEKGIRNLRNKYSLTSKKDVEATPITLSISRSKGIRVYSKNKLKQ